MNDGYMVDDEKGYNNKITEKLKTRKRGKRCSKREDRETSREQLKGRRWQGDEGKGMTS